MRLLRAGILGCALVTCTAAAAQPAGVWQGPGWGGMPPMGPPYGYPLYGEDPRVGHIDAAHFVGAPTASAQLGHGAILIHRPETAMSAGDDQDLFEAAALGQLTRAGYTPASSAAEAGQELEIQVSRQLIAPPEPPHSPVSGEVGVGGAIGGPGYRGTGGEIAIAVDLSKPRGALIETFVNARIIETSTKQILWQGRASVVTRENDRHWNDEALATRLMGAMLKGFPSAR